jgi:hypothetical protein
MHALRPLRNHSPLLTTGESLEGSPLLLENRLDADCNRPLFTLYRQTHLLDTLTEPLCLIQSPWHCVKGRRIYPRKE